LKKTFFIKKLSILILCFQDDVSLNGYKKYLISQSSPAPLTAAEEELRQIKINEVLIMSSSTGGKLGAEFQTYCRDKVFLG